MTVLEPIPGDYGKADWVDYSNFWREKDAEWIQDHMILRALDNSMRDSFGMAQGQVVYNASNDQLELMSATGIRAVRSLPATLTTAEVAGPPQKTTISHTAAGGKGLVFSAGEIGVTADSFNVLNGVFTAAVAGITFKTGTKTAKFTTDATNLISDTPISMPAVILTGTGQVLTAPGKTAQVGTLTADVVTANSGTVTGAWNAGSGTIGGVGHSGGRVTTASGAGMVGDHGIFYGDANSAVMRHWTGSAVGAPYLQVTAAGQVASGGGTFDVYNQMRVMALPIQYYYSGVGIWNIAPSFYSAGDPGAQYFPDGTIWVQ